MTLKRTIFALLAVLLIVGGGVVHGLITERWSDSAASNRAAIARLQQLPDRVGDWQSDEEFTIDERQLNMGEIDGYISRRYVNRTKGEAVNVIVVCGRPGAIAVHTPDVCFRGQGLVQQQEQVQESVTAASADVTGECWLADFVKPNAPFPAGLRVFWTWTPNGRWTAPSYPRVEFAGERLLYKMYVTSALTEDEDAAEAEGPARRFLAEWIPAVNRVLFQPADDSAEAPTSKEPRPPSSG